MWYQYRLARCHWDMVDLERFEEAEAMLQECLERRERVLEPGHWHIANARSLLGESLAGQKRFVEAESLLIEGYDTMEPPTQWAVRKTEALERVIALYDAWHEAEPGAGHDAEAAQWRAKLRR